MGSVERPRGCLLREFRVPKPRPHIRHLTRYLASRGRSAPSLEQYSARRPDFKVWKSTLPKCVTDLSPWQGDYDDAASVPEVSEGGLLRSPRSAREATAPAATGTPTGRQAAKATHQPPPARSPSVLFPIPSRALGGRGGPRRRPSSYHAIEFAGSHRLHRTVPTCCGEAIPVPSGFERRAKA